MDYANTTTNKTILSRSNNVANLVQTTVSMWRSTAAITSILVYANGTYPIGATFKLYGIEAAK
jgi:prophage DNA circulation protein